MLTPEDVQRIIENIERGPLGNPDTTLQMLVPVLKRYLTLDDVNRKLSDMLADEIILNSVQVQGEIEFTDIPEDVPPGYQEVDRDYE